MLTERQSEVLKFVVDYQMTNGGQSPSLDEIAAFMRVRSKSTAFRIVMCLEERGFVRRKVNRARGIEVVKYPAEAPLQAATVDIAIMADTRLLDSIVSEDMDAGTVVVKLEALGDLDIALSEHRAQHERAA